jgi:hypothetical protein
MSKVLDDLLASAASGVPALEAHVARLGGALTPALANEARDSYQRALQAHQADAAFFGAWLASILYVSLGLKKEALLAHADWFQILFIKATTVDEYQSVHEMAHQTVARARAIHEREIAFHAHVQAADSAYFASEAAGKDSSTKQRWLAEALNDLLAAFAEEPGTAANDLWRARLLSVLCAVVEELELSQLAGDPGMAATLRQVAAAADAHVPVDFPFPADATNAAWIARWLAKLSSGYGDRAIGKRRQTRADSTPP